VLVRGILRSKQEDNHDGDDQVEDEQGERSDRATFSSQNMAAANSIIHAKASRSA
jgi:hypothetical protein